MNETQREIISEYRSMASETCAGCGGYTADGEPTGNTNIKHFALHTGNNGAYVITYCQECAAKVAQFLLEAWK